VGYGNVNIRPRNLPRSESVLPPSPRPLALPGFIAAIALVVTLGTACARPTAVNPGLPAGPPAASPAASVVSTPAAPIEATPPVAPTPSRSPGTPPLGTAVPSASPAAVSAAPTVAPTPAPAFEVLADPPFVGRGETLLVRAVGVAGGTLQAGTRAIPLIPAPAGAWAVVAVGLYTDLGPATVTLTGRDEQGRPLGQASAEITVVDPNRPADYLVVTEETASILTPEAAATETRLRAEQFATSEPAPLWRTAFRHPVLAFEVTTQFGSGRSINGGPIGDFHSGQDLAADEGTPVTAAAPGRVSWVGAMPIRGNTVIIDHGAGVKTGYHHLLDTTVTAGQPIDAGALIGHLGSTGFSTGPHLHWELTIFGVNVDPETWVTRGFPR
jgi:murein DD-endopeptidase MepM/ murein hydrolase activator NlpD